VSGTTPDAFNLLPNPSPGTVVTCPASFINIPKLSDDGITGLGAPTEAFFDFSSVICGSAFGVIAPPATVYGPLSLTTRTAPFIVGVYSVAAATTAQVLRKMEH